MLSRVTGKRTTPAVRAYRRLIHNPETGCLEWQGAQDGRGYGQINVGGRPEKVHRLMYRLFIGEIPENLSIDHLCRNRICAAPEHLEAVTLSENTRRQLEAVGHHNAKKSHCSKGHPYDESNTRYGSKGYGRVCRECAAERNRAYRRRKKERQ